MSLETTTSNVKSRAEMADSLGSKIKFAFNGGEGVVLLDGSGSSNTVSNEDGEADCTVHLDLSDFNEMLAGNLNPMMAFMTGKLRIEGDMGVAMKLTSLF
ncbi:MAG: sterol-binding protein [Bacteroidetes bacterium]|jgi:putative sterol carrier protein|nr:MAG: sterol-binding protein [Bacteroidota bacterium]